MSTSPPLVLVVADDAPERSRLQTLLHECGYRTAAVPASEESIARARADRPAVVVLDIAGNHDHGVALLAKLRRAADGPLPIIVLSHDAPTSTVLEAMRLGATDFLCRPLEDPALLEPLEQALHQQRLTAELAPIKLQVEAEPKYRLLTGLSPRMHEVQRSIERVAATDSTVLVRGESGTGKELVAREIHAQSGRADGPFVKVNCAALPGELLESELFGYERGAFAGAAQQKPGRFDFANQGTIFLDEIGDTSPSVQARLLRVLQDGEFFRPGGKAEVRVDVRIVAGTEGSLERSVAAGTFRGDLFSRLEGMSIALPPLRDRREDVPMFVEHFLRKFSVRYNKLQPPLAPDTSRLLSEYEWPGNLRELEDAIQRAVIVGSDAPLARELRRAIAAGVRLPAPPATALAAAAQAPSPAAADAPSHDVPGVGTRATESLKDIARAAARAAERVAISRMLQRTRWNRKAAAEFLGISYKALLYKIKENGLDKSPTTT